MPKKRQIQIFRFKEKFIGWTFFWVVSVLDHRFRICVLTNLALMFRCFAEYIGYVRVLTQFLLTNKYI